MTAAGDTDRVTRLATADGAAVMGQIAGSGLLERGSVTVISVDAVRARAGDRWARKQDAVWSYVARKFEEHLSIHDMRARISETDFLIAITTEEGVAAQAISLKILEEVLVFFLGEATGPDLKIRCATGIDGDGLTCEAVNLAEIAAERRRSQATGGRIGEKAAQERSAISFVAACGETVRVDFSLERIINLGRGVTAALRVQPTVRFVATGVRVPSHAFGKLADEDIAFIDQATLRFGALHLPKQDGPQPPVVLPMSFRTLGLRRGRNMLIGFGGSPPAHIKRGALIEITEVDRGTPPGRLAEVTTLVGQLCRGVLVRVAPGMDALAPIRGLLLRGMTFDTRDLPLDDQQLSALYAVMAQQMQGKAPMVAAQGLPAASWLSRVRTAGFSHATVRTALAA